MTNFVGSWKSWQYRFSLKQLPVKRFAQLRFGCSIWPRQVTWFGYFIGTCTLGHNFLCRRKEVEKKKVKYVAYVCSGKARKAVRRECSSNGIGGDLCVALKKWSVCGIDNGASDKWYVSLECIEERRTMKCWQIGGSSIFIVRPFWNGWCREISKDSGWVIIEPQPKATGPTSVMKWRRDWHRKKNGQAKGKIPDRSHCR